MCMCTEVTRTHATRTQPTCNHHGCIGQHAGSLTSSCPADSGVGTCNFTRIRLYVAPSRPKATKVDEELSAISAHMDGRTNSE